MNNCPLPELLCRQNQPEFVPAANRWMDWAQGLWARYSLTQIHQNTLVMTLRALTAPFIFQSHRWQNAAYHFLPQIKLSFMPLLREFGAWGAVHRLESSSWPQMQLCVTSLLKEWNEKNYSNLQHEVRYHANHTLTLPKLKTASLLHELNARESAHDNVMQRAMQWAAPLRRIFQQPRGIHLNKAQRGAWEATRLVAPLQRVFHRLEEESMSRYEDHVTVREAQQMVKRVLHERQRVEERVLRPATMQSLPKPRVKVAEPAIADTPTNAQATKLPTGWTTMPPAINLEKLTDQVVRQIDQRMIGYRERFGKAF